MEKAKNILTVLTIIFLCVIAYYGMTETANDDLRNYHGYTIKKVYLSRASSTVFLEDSAGHVVEKLFDNEELQSVIIGLKIK